MQHDQFFSNDSRNSQIRWACEALLSGRTIGHNDEISEAQGWRLAPIVQRLKGRYYWPIASESFGTENRASFQPRPGIDRAKLELPPSDRDFSKGANA